MPSNNKFRTLASKAAKSSSKQRKNEKSKSTKKLKSKVSQSTTSESDDDESLQRISSENLAKLPTITSEELTFFKLVQDGDSNGLKDFLSSEVFTRININKTDKYGFSALHHAVRAQHEEIVVLLLSQEGILTHDTVFYAIQEENLSITQMLLEHEDANKPQTSSAADQWNLQNSLAATVAPTALAIGAPSGNSSSSLKLQSAVKVASRQSLKDLEDFDSEFPSHFTHFLKAAQMGNAELMELFWSRGERLESLEEHHNVGCGCRICKGSDKLITNSYERVHLFDALTNPSYICFLSSKKKSSFDPINYAIKKIMKCSDLMDKGHSFQDKYEEYIKRLEEFITNFLSLCKTNDESETFMTVPLDDSVAEMPGNKYKRLETLVSLKLVHIVAHPHAQYVVYKQWASSHWPEWGSYSYAYQLLHLSARIVLFPLISMILWTGNRSKFCRQLACPASRCLNWLGSYLVFLGILFVQGYLPQRCNDGFEGTIPYQTDDGHCIQRGAPNIGTELLIILYTLGFFVSTVKKNAIPWIWDSYWAYFELFQQLLLVATIVCWAVARSGEYAPEPRKYWGQFYPEVVAEVFLSLAIIFSFGRIFRLIQLNRKIGPLSIGLGRMVTRLLPGIVLYLVIICSYCTGLHAVYVPYHGMAGFDSSHAPATQSSPFGEVLPSAAELFWGTFGMSGSDKANIVQLGVKIDDTNYNLRQHWVNVAAGKILFGSFHVLGILMMFNLLVAFFTSDFDGILENADAEWKFARTQIYMTYMQDTELPPPFNLIPTVRGILRFFEYCTHLFFGEASNGKAAFSSRRCCYIIDLRDPDSDRRRRKAYRRLILQLTNRYHRFLEDQNAETLAVKDDVLEIGEELAELKSVIESRLRKAEGSQHLDISAPDRARSHSLGQLNAFRSDTGMPTWSRTKRILFHRGSKGLISKTNILARNVPSGQHSRSNTVAEPRRDSADAPPKAFSPAWMSIVPAVKKPSSVVSNVLKPSQSSSQQSSTGNFPQNPQSSSKVNVPQTSQQPSNVSNVSQTPQKSSKVSIPLIPQPSSKGNLTQTPQSSTSAAYVNGVSNSTVLSSSAISTSSRALPDTKTPSARQINFQTVSSAPVSSEVQVIQNPSIPDIEKTRALATEARKSYGVPGRRSIYSPVPPSPPLESPQTSMTPSTNQSLQRIPSQKTPSGNNSLLSNTASGPIMSSATQISPVSAIPSATTLPTVPPTPPRPISSELSLSSIIKSPKKSKSKTDTTKRTGSNNK